MKQHQYIVQVQWTGNDGEGTKTYRAYRRDHTISAGTKMPIPASSDPAFRGDPTRYNPEELFVSALSSCHMLWYLHLCSAKGIVVTEYSDAAEGTMDEAEDGSGAFSKVILRPSVRINGDASVARALHDDAHRFCFIANSVRCSVAIEPTIIASA